MISRFPVLLVLGVAILVGPVAGEEEELPILVRSFAAAENPAPPFGSGTFIPQQGETVALIGGTNTFDEQRFGHLEMRFQLAWPDRELKFRNLGWQGDTLFYQARPRFFYTKIGDPQPGSSPDTRERTVPGIIVINFGKLESLEGIGSLSGFLASYGELLDQLQSRTGRIVLVGPTPFFPNGPAASLTETRNETLGEFVNGIRQLAEDRGLLFVDAFSPLLRPLDPSLSANGIHLSESGHVRVAYLFAEQLNFPPVPAVDARSSASQSLLQSIQRKNRLWHQYYHPTNWAFLFGDRQHVPASRDHEDTRNRWFLKEIDSLPSLIAETDTDIHRYAREAAGSAKP